MRFCASCGVEKTPKNTGKSKWNKDGLDNYCLVCKRRVGKESYERHKEEINKRRSQKYLLNLEENRLWAKKWRAKNKEKLKETNRLRRLKHPDKVKAESAKSQKKNRAHINEYKRKWREANKDRIKEKMPLNQKMSLVISGAIRTSLYGRKNGSHWEKLVGFTLKELMDHLEKQFKDGMSWENYGRKGWHIDHKIPIAAFNFETSDDLDFKRCWALKNLQPLWAEQNLKKNSKLEKPFQPALAIGVMIGGESSFHKFKVMDKIGKVKP